MIDCHYTDSSSVTFYNFSLGGNCWLLGYCAEDQTTGPAQKWTMVNVKPILPQWLRITTTETSTPQSLDNSSELQTRVLEGTAAYRPTCSFVFSGCYKRDELFINYFAIQKCHK
jgi:hypothetical protein